MRLGFSLREDLSFQLRYSVYSQKVTLPFTLNNCNNLNPDFLNTFPTPNVVGTSPATTPPIPLPAGNLLGQTNCYLDGESSLAVRRELAQGAVLTSLVGYDVSYNTLDNNRNPTSGLLAVLKQDFAGWHPSIRAIIDAADKNECYRWSLHNRPPIIRNCNSWSN